MRKCVVASAACVLSVIGGGIIGLAVAAELVRRGTNVTVLEKEHHWAAHQTGHNW